MEKVREWLALTGKSAAQLGREIGASENSVNNWLEGRHFPSAVYLRRLHERTDIPLDDLVPREDPARLEAGARA